MVDDFLIGCDEIIMAIIKESTHSNDHSDEKRYNDAMNAIFGKSWVKDPKIPAELTIHEMAEIIKLQKDGKPLSKTIRGILGRQLGPIETTDKIEKIAQTARNEALYNAKYNAIRKYLERHTPPEDGYIKGCSWYEDLQQALWEREEKIDAIFDALRKAGWGVFRDKKL